MISVETNFREGRDCAGTWSLTQSNDAPVELFGSGKGPSPIIDDRKYSSAPFIFVSVSLLGPILSTRSPHDAGNKFWEETDAC